MSEPYTIKLFVPDGDPEGVKIVELLNWTGIGIAFPRSAWPGVSSRPEFDSSGVYILSGADENAADDLPTLYIGQGESIRDRLQSHYVKKEFWSWGYAFVSAGNALNRAHITWLEAALIERANRVGQAHLENSTSPKEPSLSESDRADTRGFLREMLRILPLFGVSAFKKPKTLQVVPEKPGIPQKSGTRDTVVVPAQLDGFREVFLGESRWRAIRIGGGMLEKIKYIAAYQTSPTSAITHYARVERIEPYGDSGKYQLIFSGQAIELERKIPFGDAPQGSIQGPRYTNLKALMEARSLSDLVPWKGV